MKRGFGSLDKKIITIHQPEHLPWLGYFNKMSKADVYVILDSVPFRKNYFQNRNKVLGSNGEQWLGVPVITKGHMEGTIMNTRIATESNPKWREKYLNTIKSSYCKHPFFEEVFEPLSDIIRGEYIYICDLNIAIIRMFAERFGLSPQFVRSSSLEVRGTKSDLILNICKELNATTYIAGPSGRDYLNVSDFDNNKIKVVYNDYSHPQYEQRRTSEFVSYLSTLDLVMNCGFETGYKILMKNNEFCSSE